MKYFTVPNLDKWQHYKDRCPPWIKLHRDVLNDYEFSRLQDASKAHLLSIWVLASQMGNKLPYDDIWLSQRINATSKIDLKKLEVLGFINIIPDDSDMLADCEQSADGEEEEEEETETETETEISVPLKDGSFYSITQKEIDEFIDVYEKIDCVSEIKKLRLWNISNVDKRKTRRGFMKHANSWLSSANDKHVDKSKTDMTFGTGKKIL